VLVGCVLSAGIGVIGLVPMVSSPGDALGETDEAAALGDEAAGGVAVAESAVSSEVRCPEVCCVVGVLVARSGEGVVDCRPHQIPIASAMISREMNRPREGPPVGRCRRERFERDTSTSFVISFGISAGWRRQGVAEYERPWCCYATSRMSI
jgi:hypothetical protein